MEPGYRATGAGLLEMAKSCRAIKQSLNSAGNRRKGQRSNFKKQEKQIVKTAIINEVKHIGQRLEALIVCTNHIHLAARPCDKSIERIVGMYKSPATLALRCFGRAGKIWTTGFDKRFCFTADEPAAKIEYIQNHA